MARQTQFDLCDRDALQATTGSVGRGDQRLGAKEEISATFYSVVNVRSASRSHTLLARAAPYKCLRIFITTCKIYTSHLAWWIEWSGDWRASSSSSYSHVYTQHFLSLVSRQSCKFGMHGCVLSTVPCHAPCCTHLTRVVCVCVPL